MFEISFVESMVRVKIYDGIEEWQWKDNNFVQFIKIKLILCQHFLKFYCFLISSVSVNY